MFYQFKKMFAGHIRVLGVQHVTQVCFTPYFGFDKIQTSNPKKVINTDFSNLENDFLKICLLETVISNLILKKPLGLPGPQGVWGGGVCVRGWSGVKRWGVGWWGML